MVSIESETTHRLADDSCALEEAEDGQRKPGVAEAQAATASGSSRPSRSRSPSTGRAPPVEGHQSGRIRSVGSVGRFDRERVRIH